MAAMLKVNRERGGLIALVAIGVMALMLLSTWSSAWATPPQDPARQTIPPPAPGQTTSDIDPGRGGTITSGTGDVRTNIPVGATTEPIILSLIPMSVEAAPAPAAAGFTLVGHVFTLDAYKEATLLPGFTFAKPVQMTIAYTLADLLAAGNNPNNLVIQYFDPRAAEGKGAWVSLPVTVDPVNQTITADVTQLGWFALATKAVVTTPTPVVVPTPVELPKVGEEIGATPGLLIALVAGAMLLVWGGYYFRKAR